MKGHRGYVLPVVSDADRICFRVSVPNDQQHIAAFMGQLAELGFWYAWQRDELKFGKDVAAIWRGIFEDTADNYQAGNFFLGDCDMSICDEVNACPPNIREGANGLQWFNPAHGVWEDLPFPPGDPRTDGDVPAPWTSPPEGETGKCLAAVNIVAAFKSLNDKAITQMAETLAVLDLVLIVSGLLSILFPPWALLGVTCELLADLYLSIGAAEMALSLTSDQYDKIKCIIECDVHADGKITPQDLANISTDASLQLNVTTNSLFQKFLQTFGKNGLMRLETVTGLLTGDCSDCTDCNWCHTFDFSIDEQGWLPVHDSLVGDYAVYSGGRWNNITTLGIHMELRIYCPELIGLSSLVSVEINGDSITALLPEFMLWDLGNSFGAVAGTGPFTTYALAAGVIGYGRVDLYSPGLGIVDIRTITIRGTGANPFSDNCA